MKKNYLSSSTYAVVYVTASTLQEGRHIARHLLEQKLIACANIVPAIESHYVWEGKAEQSKEVLLILKTRRALFAKIVRAVKQVHRYQVPEIILLPIAQGDTAYLQWVGKSVLGKKGVAK